MILSDSQANAVYHSARIATQVGGRQILDFTGARWVRVTVTHADNGTVRIAQQSRSGLPVTETYASLTAFAIAYGVPTNV